MKQTAAFSVACAMVVSASVAGAQNYRIRLDAQGQAVSFRGLVSDSIRAALVVPSSSGGLETPDGYAVRCGGGDYCYFFRPGPILRGYPVTTTASAVVWGLGVEGLVFHATGRLVRDFGNDHVWPGSDPTAQLIDGYFEYRRASAVTVVARAGRQLVTSRLEPVGFDGAWLTLRKDSVSLAFTGYGGWGLGQAAAVSAMSPTLNPLDEWRPSKRQIVAGAEASWTSRVVDARAEYRREIDPVDHSFVSERTALSFSARAAALRATGGADYNIAEGHMGSSDITLTWVQPRYSLSGGARRYRPYFSLWTLWGAFSPVPYNAVNASAQMRATSVLSLHARAERYKYDDAEISTTLVQIADHGWRANGGATARLNARWTLDGNYGLEHGPGASLRFADGTVTFTPSERYSIDVYGGTMARPLELRFYDATSRWIGARAEWQVTTQRRLWGDLARVSDNRERPDVGATSLAQLRVRAGLSVTFGSGADRTPLPPARRTGQ